MISDAVITSRRESRNDVELVEVNPAVISAEKLSEKLLLNQYDTNQETIHNDFE